MTLNRDFSNYNYQISKELGRNRQGGRITYLGNNLDSEQQVVIKEFRFADPDSSWAGFKSCEREVQMLQKLEHPGIPRYLDCFETETGFCIVQEYKQAPSLAEVDHFTPEEIKQIAVEILEILAYLQAQEPPIIHRDLKPENILVNSTEPLEVTLVDFGFATGEGDVTSSSLVKGTVGFMPPEQLLNHELSLASDLYSLAITLICLLTQTKTNQIGKLIDENYRINFKHLCPNLSRKFLDWLEKMAAPNPKNRFPNAAAALEALQPIAVFTPSWRDNLKQKQPTLVFGLTSITAFALGLGITVASLEQSYTEIAAQQEVSSTSQEFSEYTNCPGCSLAGYNLQGENLRDAQLEGVDLEGANLKGANLSGANLRGANLRGAQLQGADLTYAQLHGVDLTYAQLQGAKLQNSDLEGADLSHAQLRGANLEKVSLRDTKINYATQLTDKWRLVWRIVNNGAEGVDLKNVDLSGANLNFANLRWANLEGVNLEGAFLQGAFLEGAQLRNASLFAANLEGTNLQDANLENVNLREAFLQNADLENAYLYRAFMQNAMLYDANLRSANLQDADISDANFQGANLQDTIMP
ncbi:serine/threonine-protein kinase [Oscillatoria salina]|uniref:serine/threonine-protein kinase n=1 Tax=Oscillatoria salina TaxID=331517 RepID=UPI0013BE10CC|nr:serine/threonine-protein kinase [Oscillatoria salina]MBZ8179041.1 protein kinase [Oscillatoria salina IIICB1]NET88494.1 protein kinase [Kamptonema sp. SIO1D9]